MNSYGYNHFDPKNRMKAFELFRCKMFAFLLALKRSEKAPLDFSQAEKAETMI